MMSSSPTFFSVGAKPFDMPQNQQPTQHPPTTVDTP